MHDALLVLDEVLAWAFPISGILLFMYPVALFAWTVAEGHSVAVASKKCDATCRVDVSKFETKCAKADSNEAGSHSPRRLRGKSLLGWACIFVGIASVVLTADSVGFVSFSSGLFAASAVGTASHKSDASLSPDEIVQASLPSSLLPWYDAKAVSLMSAMCGGLVIALRSWAGRPGLTSKGSAASREGWLTQFIVRPCLAPLRRRTTRRATAEAAAVASVSCATVSPKRITKTYSAPPAANFSLWHDVDLEVKTWLDESTGLFRYVNEMPLGSLQKFEVQPHLAHNAIAEDPKGSSRLKSFGRPVPFNYGCFPQTYRDPNQVDDIHGAPGDDDPLDVLDLSASELPVGAIVQCRPLGAVCLIDEGKADWKILAVNVEAAGPLANAHSVEEVERIIPGRIQECLTWIDDFKRSAGSGDEAKLHFEVHDANRAISLVKQDHASWRQLISEAGSDGTARGHWICNPRNARAPQAAPLLGLPATLLRAPSQRHVRTQVALAASSSDSRALVRAQESRRALGVSQDGAHSPSCMEKGLCHQ